MRPWIWALSLALLQPNGARAPDRCASVAEPLQNACLAGELKGLQAEQAPGTAPGPCLGLLVFCLKSSLLTSLFFSLMCGDTHSLFIRNLQEGIQKTREMRKEFGSVCLTRKTISYI